MPTLAALASGLMLYSAFPPVAQTDAAWFALAPLLLALRRASPRAGFRLGWLTGFVFWLGSLSWIWKLIGNGGPWALVLLGHAALAAYCALYLGLFGMLSAWLWRDGRLNGAPWRRLGVVLLWQPLLWAGLEYLRGEALTGFPWNALGVSQYRNLALIQLAAWGGAGAVSLLLMAVNGGIAAMVQRTWDDLNVRRRRRPLTGDVPDAPADTSPTPPTRVFMLRSVELLLAMLTVAGCCLWGIKRLQAVERESAGAPRLRLALIHPDAPSIFERNDAGLEQLSADLLAYTELAAAAKPDLCIWPETTLPGAIPLDASTLALASNAVARACAPLLAGGVEIEPGPGWEWQVGAHIYNAAFLFDRLGNPARSYRKQHLVPFGEYIPFDRYFPWLTRLSPIGYSCSPGTASTIMRIPAPGRAADAASLMVPISPLICFEDTMPYLSRRAAHAGARLLINLTNDAWFDGSCESEQHLAQAVFRCVENGLPMVRCANSGVTCTINAAGRINRRLGTGRGSGMAGFLYDELAVPDSLAPTLYRRYGDLLLGIPGAVLALALLARILWARRRHAAPTDPSPAIVTPP
ncbi:MAG: apolipoprotein N-acyltransferase [Kiritimatiellae bacterium]|nr:apolipoprotein N-acyltransferase [Kiritimatiellia bacterium]